MPLICCECCAKRQFGYRQGHQTTVHCNVCHVASVKASWKGHVQRDIIQHHVVMLHLQGMILILQQDLSLPSGSPSCAIVLGPSCGSMSTLLSRSWRCSITPSMFSFCFRHSLQGWWDDNVDHAYAVAFRSGELL